MPKPMKTQLCLLLAFVALCQGASGNSSKLLRCKIKWDGRDHPAPVVASMGKASLVSMRQDVKVPAGDPLPGWDFEFTPRETETGEVQIDVIARHFKKPKRKGMPVVITVSDARTYRFALTVDGEKKSVELEKGRFLQLDLTLLDPAGNPIKKPKAARGKAEPEAGEK